MTNILMISNFIIIFLFFLKLKSLPPEIPLFYSRPEGELQITEIWMIFLLPILANSFFYLNNYFLDKFFKNDLVIKKIFFYLNIFIIISFSLIFIKIIFLIT